VIQHVGHVIDARDGRHQPQEQVVVLRPFHPRAQAAGAADQVGACAYQVSHVVLRPGQRRRPVRLEQRQRAVPSVDADLVLVAVDQRRIRMCIDVLRQRQQRMRRQFVIVVEKHHILAARQIERAVGRGTDVAAIVAPVHPHARLACGQRREHRVHVRRAGGVVGDAQLPVRIDLAGHRLDHPLQHRRVRLEHRHDDRENGRAAQRGDQRLTVAAQVRDASLLPGDPLPVRIVLRRARRRCRRRRRLVGLRARPLQHPAHRVPQQTRQTALPPTLIQTAGEVAGTADLAADPAQRCGHAPGAGLQDRLQLLLRCLRLRARVRQLDPQPRFDAARVRQRGAQPGLDAACLRSQCRIGVALAREVFLQRACARVGLTERPLQLGDVLLGQLQLVALAGMFDREPIQRLLALVDLALAQKAIQVVDPAHGAAQRRLGDRAERAAQHEARFDVITQRAAEDRVAPVQPVVEQRGVALEHERVRHAPGHAQRIGPVQHVAQVRQASAALDHAAGAEEIRGRNREIAPQQRMQRALRIGGIRLVPRAQDVAVHRVPPERRIVVDRAVRVDQAHRGAGEIVSAVRARARLQPREPLRVVDIVGVEYREIAAAGNAESAVDRRVRARVGLCQHANAGVVEAVQDLGGAVGRTVVDGDQFPVRERLAQHARDRLRDEALVVVRRKNDGNEGRRGHGTRTDAGRTMAGAVNRGMIGAPVRCVREHTRTGRAGAPRPTARVFIGVEIRFARRQDRSA
jgi:hypothetical protein